MLLKESSWGFRWFVPVGIRSRVGFRHQRLSRYYAAGVPSIKPAGGLIDNREDQQTQGQHTRCGEGCRSLQSFQPHTLLQTRRQDNSLRIRFALRLNRRQHIGPQTRRRFRVRQP